LGCNVGYWATAARITSPTTCPNAALERTGRNMLMRVSYGLGDRLEQTRPGFEAKVRAKVRVRVRDRVRVTSGSCTISYLSLSPTRESFETHLVALLPNPQRRELRIKGRRTPPPRTG